MAIVRRPQASIKLPGHGVISWGHSAAISVRHFKYHIIKIEYTKQAAAAAATNNAKGQGRGAGAGVKRAAKGKLNKINSHFAISLMLMLFYWTEFTPQCAHC